MRILSYSKRVVESVALPDLRETICLQAWVDRAARRRSPAEMAPRDIEVGKRILDARAVDLRANFEAVFDAVHTWRAVLWAHVH